MDTDRMSVVQIMFFVVLITAAILCLIVIFQEQNSWEYVYTDMNGNEGVSSSCKTIEMGEIYCKSDNGSTIKVKTYKGVKKDGN